MKIIQLQKVLLATLVASALVACGGGGDGDNNGSNTGGTNNQAAGGTTVDLAAYTYSTSTNALAGTFKINADNSAVVSINNGQTNFASTPQATKVIATSGSSLQSGLFLGNNIAGQVCNSNQSVYSFVVSSATRVTDINELKGKQFVEYEDCARVGEFTYNSNGSVTINPDDSATDDQADANLVATVFSDAGLEEPTGSGDAEVTKAVAYKVGDKYVVIFRGNLKNNPTSERYTTIQIQK